MSTLTTDRQYLDGDDLTQAQLDALADSIETWANGNVDASNIASGGVGTTQLASSAVTAIKLASDAVTTAKILDAVVTTAKINDAAVTTAKINDAAVTTAKLVDANVTGAKIAATTVARTNLTSMGEQTSSSCGSYTMSSSTYATVTNLSVSLTCTGSRPVMLLVQPDNTGTTSFYNTGSTTSALFYRFRQDGSAIGPIGSLFGGGIAQTGGAPIFQFVPTPTAGSHTFDFQINSLGSTLVRFENFVLIAFELG